MKITCYLKETLLSVICTILLIAITDLVLLASSTIAWGNGDIAYLNILLVLTAVIFWTAGYTRFRQRYLKLYQALARGEDIERCLPQDAGFYTILVKDAVALKNKEILQKIGLYKNNIDELNDYIAKWVHEIKIPISVCELILEDTDFSESDVSRKLRLELERTKFLVNQVLYAGRAASYCEDLSVSEFNLVKTVTEAIRRNTQFFISKNIEVMINLPEFNILNDEKWVSYILDQILNNAGKYVGLNGRIEISACEDSKAVRLHIRDNGIGIPAQDISRIFDRGFTGENGRRTTKSTGMGLYFSKKMADRLGVGLEVYSTPGEYTEFVLAFFKLNDYFRV